MGLILIRHPETEHNKAKVFPDYAHAPYTPAGESQLADVLAQDFAVSHIYSSPLTRALTMARRLGEKYAIDVRVDDRLREIDLGWFAGLTFDQVEATFPELMGQWMSDPWHFQYPQGEAYPDLIARVEAFLDDLLPDSIVCTHQAVCQVITAQFGDERPMKTGEWRYYENNPVARP